mgnify:CR=1 FL=1
MTCGESTAKPSKCQQQAPSHSGAVLTHLVRHAFVVEGTQLALILNLDELLASRDGVRELATNNAVRRQPPCKKIALAEARNDAHKGNPPAAASP